MSNSSSRDSILAAILSKENFWPAEPRSLQDTGLPTSAIESLVCKRLAVVGMSSGRQLAKHICLPFQLMEELYQSLRERQIIVHKGSAPLNDYTYALTEKGRQHAQSDYLACAYAGPAPVPLVDYVVSAEAQTIRHESPKRRQLEEAFTEISVNREIFETLGPAINSGTGLFLYGAPGNGKTTIAKHVIRCFGQHIWIPNSIIDDGQIVKLFDPSLHEVVDEADDELLANATFDSRWLRIKRPTVIVGGELTLDSLEIRHDPKTNVSEAPLQMKSNCGCFLIDDFGRQRIEPTELLNRWIVPLENRIDYLTLSTGKKIQVPFEQLIVFSTNLDPSDLVDEAFLRRIPYKILVRDPERAEFHELFKYNAEIFKCEYRPEVVESLLAKHYFTAGRELRRCHPRDLLKQVRNYCVYNDIRIEMREEYFDYVVNSYFADNVMMERPGKRGATDAILNDQPQPSVPLCPQAATDSAQEPPADPELSVPCPPSAPPAPTKPLAGNEVAARTMVCDPREIAEAPIPPNASTEPPTDRSFSPTLPQRTLAAGLAQLHTTSFSQASEPTGDGKHPLVQTQRDAHLIDPRR